MLNEKNSTTEALIQAKGQAFLPSLKQVRIESTKQAFRKRISSCFETLSLIDPLPSRFGLTYARNPNTDKKKRDIAEIFYTLSLFCFGFCVLFCLFGIVFFIVQIFQDKPYYKASYVSFGLSALTSLPLILPIIVGKTARIIAKCLYAGAGSNKDNFNANNIQDINDNQDLIGDSLV